MNHEIFKPIHPRARARHGIVTRVLRALARPKHTSYVCPSLKTVEAVAWAVRGYDVSWSEPRVVSERHNGYEGSYLDPASLSYAVYPDEPPHYGACRSHGVEPRGFVPAWLAHAEMDLRNWLRTNAAKGDEVMRGYGCHDCTAPATHRTLTWPYRYACKKHTAKLAYHNGAMWVQLRPTHARTGK